MKLSDLEPIDWIGNGPYPKYPDQPYVSVESYGGNSGCKTYFSTVAARALDVRNDEAIRFAKYDNRFYVYRCEAGRKGAYAINRTSGRESFTSACGGAVGRGLSAGEYMLDGPTHIEGIDLFELVPIEEYRVRKEEEAEQAA